VVRRAVLGGGAVADHPGALRALLLQIFYSVRSERMLNPSPIPRRDCTGSPKGPKRG
jgi:hypothetical protein